VWDAVGKALGQPVRALLGGYRERLPIISIGGYYMEGKTLADIGREMEAYRVAGMAGCKFKIGGLAPEADLERVTAARKAAGPDFVLMVDANRGWSTEEAIRFARLAEPLGLRWFEEPCHWHDDAAMMARVRRATRIPVTAGQSEITSHGVRRLLDAAAVDLVNFDASEGGGVTEWRRAAALCAAAGVDMAHHEESQIARPCSPVSATAPTWNASPTPPAIPSGRPCGRTAPRRAAAGSTRAARRGSASCWTRACWSATASGNDGSLPEGRLVGAIDSALGDALDSPRSQSVQAVQDPFRGRSTTTCDLYGGSPCLLARDGTSSYSSAPPS
jgi:hypothetical protein